MALSDLSFLEEEGAARELWENAEVGFAVLGHDGRIKAVNSKFIALFGFSEPELIGVHLRDLTSPGERDADAEEFSALLHGKKNEYRFRKIYQRKIGPTFVADLTVRRWHNQINLVISQIMVFPVFDASSLSEEQQLAVAKTMGRAARKVAFQIELGQTLSGILIDSWSAAGHFISENWKMVSRSLVTVLTVVVGIPHLDKVVEAIGKIFQE
jgi:PAS domain S-box-containing protein